MMRLCEPSDMESILALKTSFLQESGAHWVLVVIDSILLQDSFFFFSPNWVQAVTLKINLTNCECPTIEISNEKHDIN